ncbi:uncharacterized protein LOC118496765 [Phyllostomus discolor]|uniref:Uncharacterized protein LOC118496765 n=1 Tax=Phyllostomus discolor TaxID=89673 RepID=A0A7E6CF35_9CHIR|nr:uncharacterized protein LOC118496765 [Phyllostomus discolor]
MNVWVFAEDAPSPTTLNLPHFLLNRRVPQRTLGGDVSTNAGRGLVQKGGARAGAQGRTESSLRRPWGPCSTKDLWGSGNGRSSGPRPRGRTRGPGVWASRSWGPCSRLVAFLPDSRLFQGRNQTTRPRGVGLPFLTSGRSSSGAQGWLHGSRIGPDALPSAPFLAFSPHGSVSRRARRGRRAGTPWTQASARGFQRLRGLPTPGSSQGGAGPAHGANSLLSVPNSASPRRVPAPGIPSLRLPLLGKHFSWGSPPKRRKPLEMSRNTIFWWNTDIAPPPKKTNAGNVIRNVL